MKFVDATTQDSANPEATLNNTNKVREIYNLKF